MARHARRAAVIADIAPELTRLMEAIPLDQRPGMLVHAEQLRRRLASYQLLMSRAASLLLDQRLMAPERSEVSRLLRAELDKMF